MTRRIFLDSSVIIVGVGSHSGASHAVLRLGEIGLFKIVVCETVIHECQRNVELKLPDALPQLVELMLSIRPEVLADPTPEESSAWEKVIEKKDAPLLAAAINAKADRLLSLNTRHFTPAVGLAAGILIQTSGEFVQEVRKILTAGL